MKKCVKKKKKEAVCPHECSDPGIRKTPTCKAAVDSSLGRESMRTSISLAVRAIRAANSWAYSAQNTAQLRQSLRELSETGTTLLSQCYLRRKCSRHPFAAYPPPTPQLRGESLPRGDSALPGAPGRSRTHLPWGSRAGPCLWPSGCC